MKVAIVRSRPFGSEIEVESAGSRFAYPERIVQDFAVADPKGSAGSRSLAVAVVAVAVVEGLVEHNPGVFAIRMDCRNSRDMAAVLGLLHKASAGVETR